MDNQRKKHKSLFLKAFLKNPRRVGALNQTSDFVAKKIVNSIDFGKARCLVEFGAGVGNITQKITKKMHPKCVLLCFEIDPELADQLSKNIQDPRVKVIRDNAENIGKYLDGLKVKKADCIISTIPLTTLPYRKMKEIIKLSFQHIRDGGNYIQVQYSLVSRRHLRMLFPKMGVSFVFLNFPPAFVYVCVKS